MNSSEMKNIEKKVNELSDKIVKIECQVKSKDFDYQKVLSTIKYLYRYYDDMTKDRRVRIT